MTTFTTHTLLKEPYSTRGGLHEPGGLHRLLRSTGIACSFLAAGALLWTLAEWTRRVGASVALSESGAIELTQVALLISASMLLLRPRHGRPAASIFVLAGLLLLTMVVRELDGMFDRIYHGAWKVPAYAIVAWAGWHFLQRMEEVSSQWHRLKKTRGVGVFMAGLFVVLIQSRLLGQQSVWQGALQENYIRHAPRLVEELCELGGYGIILVSAIDLRTSYSAGVLGESHAEVRVAHQGHGQGRSAAPGRPQGGLHSARILQSDT